MKPVLLGTLLLACAAACPSTCGSTTDDDDSAFPPADAGGRVSRDGGSSGQLPSDAGHGSPDRAAPPDAAEPPDAAVEEPRDAGPVSNCDPKALYIYVVDTENRLARFDPATLAFLEVGTLDCPASYGANPFSMAVDRSATAWILYSDGSLFKASTRDAHCTATSFQPNQHGEEVFGMGFAANSPGSPLDTLFIAGGAAQDVGQGNSTLARLDTTTLQVSTIGSVESAPELTGTGDGELWGFFPGAHPPRVAIINMADGTLGTTHAIPDLDSSENPRAWAFAFWGGRFWLFLQQAYDLSTKVYMLSRVGGADFSNVLMSTGRTIVGAGVSTCAPILN